MEDYPVLLDVLEGLWTYIYNMFVVIPVDNALGAIYVIANLILQIFATA